MERSCTFLATDLVSVCVAVRGWTGSPSASPSSPAFVASGGWNPGELRCFHPVNNYSPRPGTCNKKRSTTIRPRQDSSWSWCRPGVPKSPNIKKDRKKKKVESPGADQLQENRRESSHLKYFLWRKAQNDLGPVFISNKRVGPLQDDAHHRRLDPQGAPF